MSPSIDVKSMRAKKQFGQNFLQDKELAREIVSGAEIESGDVVWEIGPGKGILTDELIKNNIQLTCFEIDRDIIPYLQKKYGSKISLINQDILRVDWDNLLRIPENSPLPSEHQKPTKAVLVANIPYNITSPLLYKLTKYASYFKRIVLMLQKEVAERIVSLPGNKTYGVLSIKIQYNFNVERLLKVTGDKFIPRPKVDSMVVRLVPRVIKPDLSSETGEGGEKFFWKIVETCFHTRRKTLRNNLKLILNSEQLELLENQLIINNEGFNLSVRGEELSEEDYLHLYNAILISRRQSC